MYYENVTTYLYCQSNERHLLISLSEKMTFFMRKTYNFIFIIIISEKIFSFNFYSSFSYKPMLHKKIFDNIFGKDDTLQRKTYQL